MKTIKTKQLTQEKFLVNETEYYFEYRGRNLQNNFEYRLINLSDTRRRPVTIITDLELKIVEVMRVKLTVEETAACRKKGMRVDDFWIKAQKPKFNLLTWILKFFQIKPKLSNKDVYGAHYKTF